MSAKKVLLVSYYFPPLGGAGIARPLNLFRHLTGFGYDCDVLTVKPVLYRAYEPEVMNELDQTKIHRSGSYDPSRFMHLIGFRKVSTGAADKSRIVSNRIFPDGKAGWIGPAVRNGSRLLKQNKYDLIVSTSPPVSAHVIAMSLSKQHNIPWVADFQDFWVSLKAEEHFKSADKIRKAKALLSEIRSNSKSITAVNRSCADYVGAETTIPICYDSALAKLWGQPDKNEPITIGLFGTVSELTPVEPLLKVLSIIREKNRAAYAKIRIIQLGLTDKFWLAQQLEKYRMVDKFELLDYQPRDEMIKTLSRAAVFYLGIDLEQGHGIVPSRLFTLLASGRPVMTYAPKESEIDLILNKCQGCLRFDESTIESAVEFLANLTEHLIPEFVAEPEYAKEYSAEKMAEKFAGVLDTALNL